MTSLQTTEPAEMTASGEMGRSASAATSMALVQAKYAIAARFPRNVDQFRTALLQECRRTKFAEASRYLLRYGKEPVTGWSIRFTETAMRLYRNVDLSTRVVHDDTEKTTIECAVIDMESNTTWSQQVSVQKSVERRRPSKTHEILSERLNAYGDTVYLVRATPAEIMGATAAAVSKTLRSLGERLLPADVLDEALDVVLATQAQADRQDPTAHRKSVADAFAALGVMPDDLAQHLGHSLQQTTPAELAELKALYQAIKSGDIAWADIVSPDNTEARESKASKVKEALEARRKKQQEGQTNNGA